MANSGTSVYPAALDAFDAPGTATYEDTTGYEHDLLHSQEQDAIEKIETTVGATAGTNVLMSFSAGHFPARVNGGGTIVQTLIGGTVNNTIIGTPAITGGTINSAILGTPTINTPTIRAWDGWIDANETWTYASATTFTVSGDVTAKYPKGTKLKLTQTTVKYFYVVATSYSAPNTTVTITGGSDYTLANAAITDNYYSYASTPQGFPQWFAWTPTCTGFSADPVLVTRFTINDRTCIIWCTVTTNGTSNATTFTMTLPVASAYSMAVAGICFITDNGAGSTTPGHMALTADSTTMDLYKTYYQGAWTASSLKAAWFTFAYEI